MPDGLLFIFSIFKYIILILSLLFYLLPLNRLHKNLLKVIYERQF